MDWEGDNHILHSVVSDSLLLLPLSCLLGEFLEPGHFFDNGPPHVKDALEVDVHVLLVVVGIGSIVLEAEFLSSFDALDFLLPHRVKNGLLQEVLSRSSEEGVHLKHLLEGSNYSLIGVGKQLLETLALGGRTNGLEVFLRLFTGDETIGIGLGITEFHDLDELIILSNEIRPLLELEVLLARRLREAAGALEELFAGVLVSPFD